ncbi:hypothetical protein E4T38_01873 [Aureobasidium subglaciale]|nr:hypothetical protein E4T38_01873 [Aureobasidium subglaciale]KAI5229347.1 hypothetical protein E4T40_01607 [Aureobasidium subglaciale]KAI5232866.1 hypothetical protein E4T41_01871 [Aureobasidium subglaciale]KAI5266361.1 hypothetical protein E4T46_01604 [Aureobasidium subglaciale]
MLVLLQSRAVEVISTTGLVSRSTSYSVVQGLPSAAAAMRHGCCYIFDLQILDYLYADDSDAERRCSSSYLKCCDFETDFDSCGVKLNFRSCDFNNFEHDS